MKDERELWLYVHLVLSHHGDSAPAFVSARIAESDLGEDEAGVTA